MFKLRLDQKASLESCLRGLKKYGWHYLCGEVRTGKTIVALYCANFFLESKPDDYLLIVTTKKAKASINSDYTEGGFKYSMRIINYEALHKVKVMPKFIIWDEAHKLGTFPKPSKRTKLAREKFSHVRCLFLSGTPSPETFTQLYHQAYVLGDRSPWARYKTFYNWAKYYVRKETIYTGNEMNTTSYKNCKAIVLKEFAPHMTSVTQIQAGFTGKVIETFHTIPLPAECKELMREVISKGISRKASIFVQNPSRKHTLVHQICSGTFKDDEKQGQTLSTFKADYIRRRFAGRKIAIFYVYKEEGRLLREYFENWTDSPEEFNASDDLVFICQIVSGREGVDLKTADDLINFNISYSATCYWQGRSRSQSWDGGDKLVHWLFSNSGVESDVYEAVTDKQDYTLKHFKQYVREKYTSSNKKKAGKLGVSGYT